MSGDKRRSFQRYLLLSEDSFRNALKCLEKQAMERTMERSAWYDQRNPSGGLRRVESVPGEQLDTTLPSLIPDPTPPPPPTTTTALPKRTVTKPSSIPMRMLTRKMASAKSVQQKGSGVRIFRVY